MKSAVDAFWADPGTLQSRQEFRGTGGSLYYLQNQDISVGSEQVWMEVRDRDSGLVLSVTPLVPVQDYDINYMQGRILLRNALPATANSTTVVHSGGLDGDPGQEQDLRSVDGTLRYMPGSYIKSEYAHSDGAGTPTLTSITGGLSFNSLATSGAAAYRCGADRGLSAVSGCRYACDRGAR